LFEPLDRQGCIRALKQLLASESLRRTLAAKAHEKLLIDHSWTATAQKIMGAL
jgi:spore maturation protein CgeB